MENLESGNAATNAGHGQLAVVLNRLEQNIGDSLAGIESSFSRLADTFETTLQRLETKLNAVRQSMKLLPDHLKEKGNAAGRAVAKAGRLGFPGADTAAEWINLIPRDPEDLKQYQRFYNEDSDKLSARFRTHERDIAAYRSDPDTVTAQEDIANSYHEQELILTALITKADKYKLKLDAIRKSGAAAGGLDLSENLQENLGNLNRIIEALETIGDLATSPKLQKLIDGNLPIFLGPKPFFGEGGEPRAGGRVRPLSLGRRSGFSGGSGDDVLFGGAGSDTLGASLLRLGGNTEDATQSFAKLNEQAKRFEALMGPLATGLAETNSQVGTQAERLRGLGGLLPELGHQLIEVFDSGTVGAERLDAAVQAVGTRFLDAFEGAIRRGESLGDVLKSLGRDLADLALNEVKTGGLGGLFDILGGLFGSAKGNAFSRGHALTAYARGGAFTNTIVDRPTLFPMAAGAGLMDEAGPEAVLPLTRLANGELGVQTLAPEAVVAGPVITYNIDARGADREGLSRLAAVVRQRGATINYINRTLERRAVEAMVYTRGRGATSPAPPEDGEQCQKPEVRSQNFVTAMTNAGLLLISDF